MQRFKRRQTTVLKNGFIKNPNAKEVKISIIFTRIGEIDTINERFSCEATLFITWRENTNILQKCKIEDFEDNSYFWDSKTLWDPQLYIDNAIGDVKEKDVKVRLEKMFDDNKKEWYFEVHMIKRIQGTFFEKLELYHFPFDIQDLSITITSHRTSDEIIFVQDYNITPKMTKSASLDKHIWKLYDHVNIKIHTIKNDIPQMSEFVDNEFESVCSHSAITMQCRVSRKPGYFVINCLLPTLMITLCVFFTFMMDYSRFQYRFSLLFTTMLTSITFRWAIHGRVLPTISYMTFLDVYCVSSILIVFSCMIWHAIYLMIYKENDELAERCDRYAMITFAIIVFLVHVMQTIWFIIAFRKRIHLEKLDQSAALNYLKNRMINAKKVPKPNDQINRPSNNNNLNNSLKNNLPTNKEFLSTKNNNTNCANNNNNNLQSKRMLYSFSKLDDNSVITIHNNDSGLTENKTIKISTSTDLNKPDLVLRKKHSLNSNNITNRNDGLLTPTANHAPPIVINEILCTNINCNFVDENTTTTTQSNSVATNLSSDEKKLLVTNDLLKNTSMYFTINNKDEDGASCKNDLSYQYIPLVHQSSRDS